MKQKNLFWGTPIYGNLHIVKLVIMVVFHQEQMANEGSDF